MILGKPLAEAGKGSKTVAPIVDLAMKLMGAGDAAAENAPAKKAVAKGTSLMGKFGDFKSMMPKRKK